MGLETGVSYISDLNKLWPLGSDYGSTLDNHDRNIKTALVTSFPNVNGAVNPTPTEFNTLVGTTSSVQDQLDDKGVPVGGIIMFSGTLTNLSANWALCDGSNGTPDLGDKFVLGAQNQGEISDTGGSADAIVVTHTHTGATDSDGEHTHTVAVGVGANIPGEYYENPVVTTGPTTTSSNGAHTHDITMDSTGSSGTNANLPPYYKLAYIMRVS